ncbi:MAG: hypothetical protein KA248_00650 [Kiritimatiellae bacterium]|nr:hypothetical protein [Kiritimatiellia bacterium]
MKKTAGVLLLLGALAATARAEGPTNLFSFPEETKIKGPFAPVDGQLYFTCEKGGAYAYGYVGQFDPAGRTVTAWHKFDVETKAKGACRMSNSLWFVTEKGGAANLGYIGRFDLAAHTVERLCEFTNATSAKSAPFLLGDGFYFFAEAGGASNQGALMRYSLEGGLATVVSFHAALGIKPEARPVWFDGRLYFGTREGGDTTQQTGKGAGSIGLLDLAAGTATNLVNLNASNHGARIKALLPFGGRLYYTTDEGGDLTLNGGKGSGAAGFFDPASRTLTRLFVCNGATTGIKPKGMVAVRDRVYFNCGEGGPNGCGAWYGITDGTNVFPAATNDIPFGNKADLLTPYGRRIYCATEQGCSNWLGGISAYEFEVEEAELAARLQNGQIALGWDILANDHVLEFSPSLTGKWTVVAGRDGTNAVLPYTEPMGFFRLRQ